jgi:hypothetical protein
VQGSTRSPWRPCGASQPRSRRWGQGRLAAGAGDAGGGAWPKVGKTTFGRSVRGAVAGAGDVGGGAAREGDAGGGTAGAAAVVLGERGDSGKKEKEKITDKWVP